MQLSKDDEAAAGGEDTEVRREDQDKINRFSRLHQRETVLEERLKAKQVCSPFPFGTTKQNDRKKKLTSSRKTRKT